MVAKNVAVTGASGLLGRAVAAHFISQGDQVISLANSRADRDPQYTKLDLMDQEAVKNFFKTNNIDCGCILSLKSSRADLQFSCRTL